MKKIFLLICLFATAFGAKADNYNFPPELEELIANYGETAPAKLPNPKKYEDDGVKRSYAPGRLPMPVNVIVNKRATTLFVVNAFGDTLDNYRICCARNRGQKRAAEDCRTPEGEFSIVGIYNSTDWRYKGTGSKCYGPWFVSVNTPGFSGIGIHGTNAPGSIPGRSSHGCMRLLNENIVKLKEWINKDTRITILPDDPEEEAKQIAKIKSEYVAPGTKTNTRVKESELKGKNPTAAKAEAQPEEKKETRTTPTGAPMKSRKDTI